MIKTSLNFDSTKTVISYLWIYIYQVNNCCAPSRCEKHEKEKVLERKAETSQAKVIVFEGLW